MNSSIEFKKPIWRHLPWKTLPNQELGQLPEPSDPKGSAYTDSYLVLYEDGGMGIVEVNTETIISRWWQTEPTGTIVAYCLFPDEQTGLALVKILQDDSSSEGRH